MDSGARPAVTLTHDFAETYGGAERVLEAMCGIYPDAPVWMLGARESVLERLGIANRVVTLGNDGDWFLHHYRKLTPLYPGLISRRKLPPTDLVLSSSYAFAHHFRSVNDAPRVCYCHSPLRFAWSMTSEYGRIRAGRVGGPLLASLAGPLRWQDRRVSAEIDTYLANGRFVAEQIDRFYGREATVLRPPVDPGRFRPAESPSADYFLLCGRLIEPYKAPGIVVDAFSRMPDLELRIAGAGPALDQLKARATSNITFLGQLDDDDLVEQMQNCAAGVFPSRDDLGLIPVELASCGRPVIAYRGGGSLETVVEGVSGELFDSQTPESLIEAVRSFDPSRYDPERMRRHAALWSPDAFRTGLEAAVGNAIAAATPEGSDG